MASEQVDFGSNHVRRSVLSVAAPMLVAQLINLLYNIIEGFRVKGVLRSPDWDCVSRSLQW